VFVLAGQMLAISVAAWAARDGRARRLQPWFWTGAGTGVIVGFLYAPFASSLVAHLGADAPREAAKVATGGWAVAEAVRSLLSGAGVPAAIAGALIAIAGAFSLMRRAPLAVALLVLPAVVTAVAVIGLGQPLRPRFFFFLSGAAAIFVGRGMGAIARVIAARFSWSPGSSDPGSNRLRLGYGGPPKLHAEAGDPGFHLLVVALTLLLIALSALALPRNYLVPKQDFEGAAAFLDAEEGTGTHIATAGPACFPFNVYMNRANWACMNTLPGMPASWAGEPVLIAYTLPDYIDNVGVRDMLRSRCRIVRTFPGTLGGGDIVVCRPDRQ